MSDGVHQMPTAGRRRRRRWQVGIGSIFFVLITAVSLFRSAAVFYTDLLWFESVHLASVWTGLLSARIGLGVVSVLAFFLLFWTNLWITDRYAPRSLLLGKDDDVVRAWTQITARRGRLIRAGIALLLALMVGAGFSTHWSELLLFLNGGSFGEVDPQFGKDVGFFVFKLPFLVSLASWAFFAVVCTLVLSIVSHYLRGAIRPQAHNNRISSVVKIHVSILLGVLALVRAAQYALQRYEASYSNRGVVEGANYTDVKVLLPALLLLIAISIVAAFFFFFASTKRGWTMPVITVALWGVVSVLVGVLSPALVQKFSVEPAESTKELPYIQRNLNATRAAMNLDKVQVHDFPYSADLTAADLNANAQTIRNVRLWDTTLVKPSYQRLQETRSFFQFDDIDVDRYDVNGETTQMMLSVRELNTDGLPTDRRSWVNEHMQYTHGYGVVASPANAVTASGEPQFTLKDVPPAGQPELTRPQIYFGEKSTSSSYAIVGTKQVEVDYVSADGTDKTSTYEGSGGVALSNPVKKAAFAARVGDLKPLISGLVGSDAKAMYLTNIRDRAKKAAPFLKYDSDPYAVIDQGRVLWVQDAYTTTNKYPYAQTADTSLLESDSTGNGLKNSTFNYVRNSVKVVTDAYDGTMTFYVVDNTDPLAKAWQKAFPKLFTDGSKMTSSLREHLRYPEDLFRTQTSMYGKYHLLNATDFYRQSDRWNIAQNPPSDLRDAATAASSASSAAFGSNGAATISSNEPRISPYYLQMRLPEDDDSSFMLFQPYVPYSANDGRKELSAFMTAKSDPANYGTIDVYAMPRGQQQIDGPALVDARINQDPTIAQQITLLNRAGSTVRFGDLLIVPVKDSLLYIRPLYVVAQQTQVPEFKKAIVVHGDTIAMENTLQEALTKIFGSAPQTLEQERSATDASTGATPPAGSGTTPPSSGSVSVSELLTQAQAEFAAADESLRNGDLAAYQDHVKKGVALVQQAGSGAGADQTTMTLTPAP